MSEDTSSVTNTWPMVMETDVVVNNIKAIFGNDYDDFFFQIQASLHRQLLNEEGILVFRDFVSEAFLLEAVNEARSLKDLAYQSSSSFNIFVDVCDVNFPQDHVRNRLFHSTKRCIPHDLISINSPLQLLYNDEEFRKFVSVVVGVPAIFPYHDNLSSININYYDVNDSLEWHFDNAEFTVTLLLQSSDSGD
jgi:hypothetical protein